MPLDHALQKREAATTSYHLSVKAISRSTGRSATAAAAYRSGARIVDERTDQIHDYTRKQGVEHTEIVLPAEAPTWAADREALWNAAEQAETRKNSTVAREFEVALPAELSAEQRRELAVSFAREIAEHHKVAVDVAIHAPGKDGDERNHHAHMLVTTRRLTPDGLGEKTRELDQQQSGEVVRWRERWAEAQNQALERAGREERVNHRSLKEQGREHEPQIHMGPAISAMERRAQQEATRAGREYEPVTDVARHNERSRLQRVIEQTRDYVRRGEEWLKQRGQQVGQSLSAMGQGLRGDRQEHEATAEAGGRTKAAGHEKPEAMRPFERQAQWFVEIADGVAKADAGGTRTPSQQRQWDQMPEPVRKEFRAFNRLDNAEKTAGTADLTNGLASRAGVTPPRAPSPRGLSLAGGPLGIFLQAVTQAARQAEPEITPAPSLSRSSESPSPERSGPKPYRGPVR